VCWIAYVLVVACLFEIGENNRFRLLVEPLFAVLVARELSLAGHGLRRAASTAP
jgi:hypothetical protein